MSEINYKIIYAALFLPMIAYIGIVTSIEDISTSRIRNKYIIIGLTYALALYALAWATYLMFVLKHIYIPFARPLSYLVWNFDKWGINLVISVLVAYILWHFKMWAAGDAKLFIVYAALIPTGQYSKVYFNQYFQSFLLLMLVFIPVTVYILLKSVFFFFSRLKSGQAVKEIINRAKENIKRANKIQTVRMLLGFITLFLILKVALQLLKGIFPGISLNRNIFLIALFLIFLKISKTLLKNMVFVGVALCAATAYIITRSFNSEKYIFELISSFVLAIMLMVLIPVSKKVIEFHVENTEKKTMAFAHWIFIGALMTWFLK